MAEFTQVPFDRADREVGWYSLGFSLFEVATGLLGIKLWNDIIEGFVGRQFQFFVKLDGGGGLLPQGRRYTRKKTADYRDHVDYERGCHGESSSDKFYAAIDRDEQQHQ